MRLLFPLDGQVDVAHLFTSSVSAASPVLVLDLALVVLPEVGDGLALHLVREGMAASGVDGDNPIIAQRLVPAIIRIIILGFFLNFIWGLGGGGRI